MVDPGAVLPPATGFVIPTAAIMSCGVVVSGFAAATDQPAIVAIASVTTAAAAASVIVDGLRRKERRRMSDLFLLRLSPLLGWPAPARDQIVTSRWTGGWSGHPGRIRIHYNPLADEGLAEIQGEARRLAERAFSQKYRGGRAKPRRGWFELIPSLEVETGRELQAERVKSIVSKTFGPDSHLSMKFDGDKVTQFTVKYEVSLRLSSAAMRARIESSFSAVFAERWRAFWDLSNDVVRFEVRPDLKSLIPNPAIAPETIDPLASYDKLAVPIGVDEDGNVIHWRPKRDPHGLVTGKTGKGKTVVLLGIIMFLAAHGWKVWGIDGKRIELLGLREWPNVELIAGRIDHQARVGHEMFTMMQKRFADYEAGLVKLEDFEPVLFVIDEYKTFRNAVTRWFRQVKPKGGTSQAPVLEEISDFVSLARKVRMHLVIGLQRPDAEFLTGDMRDNFNFRVSLGRLSPDGAKMMWDSFSTGVTIPPFAIGRGIAHNEHGEPVEIQAYWTPDPYQTAPDNPAVWVTPGDLNVVERLTPKVTLHQLKEISDPTGYADLDGDGKGKEDPDYFDYMTARIVPAGSAPRPRPDDVDPLPSPRVVELERIQIEEAEPDVDDDLFAGYTEPVGQMLGELIDEAGELEGAGILALVDPDNEAWGLIDYAEEDPADFGYIAVTYRDFETGEAGQVSLPEDELLTIRRPAA
ncbi:MAG: FtsK/SpoIIIE domain-containing protein [Protaetiibacter sp.]